jgi:hypothetical protein
MGEWVHGSMGLGRAFDTHGPVNPWTYGPINPWTYGPINPWTYLSSTISASPKM